ncbi:MAG: domain containing protein [Aeromicrobium sp.]|nr:domain containing protein [Aeromicrobium sp.]
MKLKLTVQLQGARVEDIVVDADPTVSIAEVAAAIVAADPQGPRSFPSQRSTIRVEAFGGSTLAPDAELAHCGLQSGQRIAVVSADGQFANTAQPRDNAATLTVTEGPDAGKTFPLRFGSNQVGRGRSNDVRLTDPLVSKAHARIGIGEKVDIADLGSSNGVEVRGSAISRAVLGPNDIATIGNTSFRVSQQIFSHSAVTTAASAATVLFNRPPVLDPVFEGEQFKAPDLPQRPRASRFPMIGLLAPLLMGGVLFAVTRNPTSVLFIALSPIMMVGSFAEGRMSGKKAFAVAIDDFHEELRDLEVQLNATLEQESIARRAEYPSTVSLLGGSIAREPVLWSRRTDKRAFLELRLGLGDLPTRSTTEIGTLSGSKPDLVRELTDLPRRYGTAREVPVVADLVDCGSVGVAGPASASVDIARSVVLQVAALHSPAEVVIAALIAPSNVQQWDWLKWLPHTSSDHSPIGSEQIGVTSPGRVLTAIEDLIGRRSSASASRTPALVLVVDDDAVIDRSDFVELVERGPDAGVHVVWFARSRHQLPAGCRVFLEQDPSTNQWTFGDVRIAAAVQPIAPDSLQLKEAEQFARSLSPVVDAGASVGVDSDVPRQISFLSLVDGDVASRPDAVISQWRASHSLPAEYAAAAGKRRRENNLRAYVGGTAADPFVLDLRTNGPHALVGGTTGAGKSEFLQTWVLGMATAHSPSRVNFLFVDYKGGAAFGDCIQLPHCVGLVTDLSPHLVKRAIVSLKAELKYREELFNRHGKAKDLLELERRDPTVAPPSLVIIVDEFAALAKEIPEFVDGVVDVAQRGRSLGLHLILATQRPAGVIRDNLRANTNLRIALRMADEDDSMDVVGSKASAMFDPSIPGRGLAKLGPGRLVTFQAGYVGGWTTNEQPPPVISIRSFALDGGEPWELPEDNTPVAVVDSGPNDLKRVVETVRLAAEQAKIPVPRKPWQKELAARYELSRVHPSRSDTELVFGIRDDPANQQQIPVAFYPDRQGNIAVYGAGGSGKTAFLRTIAVAAGAAQDGACRVYGLDFGSRGLAMLESLPHVGAIVNGEDNERVDRLIRTLRGIANERSDRYAHAKSAATITQYRAATGSNDEPRIIVLVDNFGGLRQVMETSQRQPMFDALQRLAADGRPLGIHFVISADRLNTIPPAFSTSIQQRLILRLAQDTEYSMFGVPNGVLGPESPPGRGSMDGDEVQVAVLGGSASTSRQAAAILKLSRDLAGAQRWQPAPDVPRLPGEISLDALAHEIAGLPALGISDESLAPIGFSLEEPILVVGPPQAVPEQAMLTMVQSAVRVRRSRSVVLVSVRRSALANAFPWSEVIIGSEAVAAFARECSGSASTRPLPDLVAIDGLTDVASSDADMAVQDLIKALGREGRLLIAAADSFQVGSVYGSAQLMRSFRNGVALQPDQTEGDAIFRTSFPRVPRSDFRQGCGYLVRQGAVTKVLVASPSEAAFVPNPLAPGQGVVPIPTV